MENFIKWTVNQSGQPRPYADSIYDFTIQSNLPKDVVEQFCKQFVFKCTSKHNDIKEWWESYYTFIEKGDGTYNYHVVSPYLD